MAAGSSSSSSSSARCCFCNGSGRSLEEGGALLELEGGEMKARQKQFAVGVIHAHELCVLYSPAAMVSVEELPDDYEPGCMVGLLHAISVESVRSEARRGRQLRCALCDERGASVGCYACSRRCFHFPCAARAGLVEWHWWDSGHRARVVHCVEHLDPKCRVRGDDGAWYDAAVGEGPIEGKYLSLYDPAFGQEFVALNHVGVACGKAPTGAARWASFGALCAANEHGSAPRARGPSRDKRRAVRCVVSGVPADAVATLGPRRARRKPGEAVVARPLAVTQTERDASAAAIVACFGPRRKPAPPAPRPPAPEWRDTPQGPAARALVALAEQCLAFCAAAEVCAAAACGVDVGAAARRAAPRLFAREVERRVGAEARDDALACFGNDALRALRWLAGRGLRWAVRQGSATHHAGPGATSVRVPRPSDETATWYKTGTRSGDVTLACGPRLPEDACACWDVRLDVVGDTANVYCRGAVGLSTGLDAPSPFWLGREPRSGLAGLGFAVTTSQPNKFFATTLAPRLLQASNLPADRVAPVRSGDRIGILFDRRRKPPRLAFFRNALLLGEVDTGAAASLEDLRLAPALSLRDPGWRATITPAVPAFDARGDPLFIRSRFPPRGTAGEDTSSSS